MMNENYNTPNSGCCGRPFPTAPENKCKYNDCCMNEYTYKQKACIRNKQPDCETQAVIPSITVETVDGITNLANCFVHVSSTNTTYYVDDKHRIMITWAGPVNIPGYDMERNPEKFKDQIVTDTEAKVAVIYNNKGVGFTFGIEKDADFGEAVSRAVNNTLEEMAEDGTLENLINEEIFSDLDDRVTSNTSRINSISQKQGEDESTLNNLGNRVLKNTTDISDLSSEQVQNVKKGEYSSISMNMLTQDVREAMTGGSTAVVGLDSVGNGNIQDKAVSFTKLDDLLSTNLELEYESLEDSITYTDGFYTVTGNAVGGNLNYYTTDPTTECAEVDLVKGKTYRFTGTSYSATFGLVIGTAVGSPVTAICSKDGKLNKDFYTVPLSDQQGTNYIFTVNDTGLKAFITRNKLSSVTGGTINLLGDVRGLYEVSDITYRGEPQALNAYKRLSPDYTYDSKYLNCTETNANGNPYKLVDISDTRYKVHIYLLRRGHTYKVTGKQAYGNPGFELFNGSNILQYISLEAYTTTVENYDYEFTPTSDCFCAVGEATSSYSGTLYEKIYDPSKLAGKTIAYDGDSITESRLNTSAVSYNGGAYPKIIADVTHSFYANFAVSGGTLAYRSGGHRICRNIDNMNGDYDAIIFSGGINDYWQNIPLGTYTASDYTGTIDDTTVCGALESIFRQAINKWCGKPIMFVITHKIYNTVYNNNSAGYTFKDLHDAIVGICDKYSIPYYDCYKDGGLNSYMSIMNTTYMTAGASGNPDYTHPNEDAYKRYYVPQVISMIEDNLKY